MQLNNTLMEWKLIEVLGILTCWLWCMFCCDESWPSSFRLESIPDQQFALLISKDECVMKGMRPCRIANFFLIFRCVHSIFCEVTWSLAMRPQESRDENINRKSVVSFDFARILQKHQQFSIIGKFIICITCVFLLSFEWKFCGFIVSCPPTCQPV